MMPMLLAVTVCAALGSLWIRRHTWRCGWESGLSISIALQACALVLIAPWTADRIGSTLHLLLGRWNMQHLVGHVCLVVAAAAIVHHGLTRLADQPVLARISDRRVSAPVNLGLPLLVAVFVVADERAHRDLFGAHVGSVWFGAYWLVLTGLLVYLLGYAARVLIVLRADHRSRRTANVYLTGVALAAAAQLIQLATACSGVDVSLPVWLCACLGLIGLAYGAARSWQNRIGWFTGDVAHRTPPQPAA